MDDIFSKHLPLDYIFFPFLSDHRLGGRGRESADTMECGMNGLAEYMTSLDWQRIGNCVHAFPDLPKEPVCVATSVCRRTFKAKDIIILDILDEDGEGTAGIVFTENAIFSWNKADGKVVAVPYTDIEKIDFDDENVMIMAGEDEHRLYCGWSDDGEDERFSMYMYNFVSDIVEYIRE